MEYITGNIYTIFYFSGEYIVDILFGQDAIENRIIEKRDGFGITLENINIIGIVLY
tara:strand:+ start:5498 stop:5665 length:168 start_codon:yes stop_codon:yes gene_type:complete